VKQPDPIAGRKKTRRSEGAADPAEGAAAKECPRPPWRRCPPESAATSLRSSPLPPKMHAWLDRSARHAPARAIEMAIRDYMAAAVK